MGRPNELEPALIEWSKVTGKSGTTVNEAVEAIPHTKSGRRTPRALSLAANRLVDKGIFVRKIEHACLVNGQIIHRYRYWHSEFAPVGAGGRF